MVRRAGVTLGLVLWSAAMAQGEEDWLHPAGAEVVVDGLVERMKPIGDNRPVDEAQLREVARNTVSLIGARLSAWGEKTVMEHAPALEPLALPRAGQPHLDAMARYFACAAVYEVLHLRGRFAKSDRNVRVQAAMAPASISLASLYLRHRYLAAGGTDARMEAFLSGPPMEPVIEKIQDSDTLLESSHEQCRPLVTWLVHE
jgi:hypothetical protein